VSVAIRPGHSALAHEPNQPLAAVLSNAQAAQRFIAAHGGSIWAENTENGARLTFTLPQAPQGDGHD